MAASNAFLTRWCRPFTAVTWRVFFPCWCSSVILVRIPSVCFYKEIIVVFKNAFFFSFFFFYRSLSNKPPSKLLLTAGFRIQCVKGAVAEFFFAYFSFYESELVHCSMTRMRAHLLQTSGHSLREVFDVSVASHRSQTQCARLQSGDHLESGCS